MFLNKESTLEIPIKQIVTGVQGNIRTGHKHTLYALCDDGKIFSLDPEKGSWREIERPRTGAGKVAPDEALDLDSNRSWTDL